MGNDRMWSRDEFASFFVVEDDAYAPELDDLYFLYVFCRSHAITSVLELGSGHSTLSFALALSENSRQFGDSLAEHSRLNDAFQLLSVDASKTWSELAESRIPDDLNRHVKFHYSEVLLVSREDEVFSVFQDLPTFRPDLIYIDGPDADQARGSRFGAEPNSLHSFPIAADVARIEAQLWPGTYIIFDGRTANARFLRHKMKRDWQYIEDPFGDRTIFRLSEEPLGEVSREITATRLVAARKLLGKEQPRSS